jgi:cell division protein FtsB
MRTTTPEKRRQPILRWAALAGLALLALLANEVIGQNGYLARRQQLRQIESLNQQIDQLKQENEGLAQKIDGLRSDPSAIEEAAREQLHLGRPGEFVVTLSPPTGQQPPTHSTPR